MNDDFSRLAQDMMERLNHLKLRYPDTFSILENLQNKIQTKMSTLHEHLQSLPEKDQALLVLYVINEIHKSVDNAFSQKE